MKQQILTLLGVIDSMVTNLPDPAETKNELIQLNFTNQMLSKDIERLKRENELADAECNRLNAELSAAKSQLDQSSSAYNRFKQLSAALDALNISFQFHPDQNTLSIITNDSVFTFTTSPDGAILHDVTKVGSTQSAV